MKKILLLCLFLSTSLFAAGTTIPSLDTVQTANTILSGPTSGGAAISSFRVLVAADIPNGIISNAALAGSIDLTTKVTGILPVANGGTNAAVAGITSFNNITGYSAAGATGTTSTNLVFSTSPTLVTPILGAATATSINGNTFTTGSYTLTGTAAKTLTFTNTLTLTGTDGTTMTFPTTSATIARTDAANTFTGHQTIEGVTSTGATGTGLLCFNNTPTFIAPLLGTPTSGNLSNCTALSLTAGVTGILPGTNGGTNNGFLQFAGPAASLKTWTGPNSNATLLTDQAAVTVAQGGTGITAGVSGGVLSFTATGTAISSNLLANHAVMLGGGAGAFPYTIAVGTTNTVLHGTTAADPTWSAVSMSADVAGILPVANGGSGLATAGTSLNGVLCSGTTATGVFQIVVNGTTGQFLTAQTGALPIWTSVAPGAATSTPPLITTGSNTTFGTAQGPTIADANSSVGVGSSTAGKKVEIWQTIVNNTQPAIEVQNSTGNYQWQIDNTITSNVDIKETLRTSKQGGWSRASITETVTIANTATSSSATNLLPANAANIVVTYRVTAAITCTTTFSVGDAVSATRFGTGISKVLSTISDQMQCTPPTAPFGNKTATTILITPDTTPADSTGRLEITVWYDSFVDPGS